MNEEEINLVMGPDGELHSWEFKTSEFKGDIGELFRNPDAGRFTSHGRMTGRFKVNHPPMHFWMKGDPLGCVEPDDEGVYKITTMEGRA